MDGNCVYVGSICACVGGGERKGSNNNPLGREVEPSASPSSGYKSSNGFIPPPLSSYERVVSEHTMAPLRSYFYTNAEWLYKHCRDVM